MRRALPNWDALFGDVRAAQVAVWIVAVVLVVGLVVKLWPFVKNAVAIVDALIALPAMSKEMAAMREQITSIHHETHTNKGTSIKDAMGRVEKTVARVEETVSETSKSVEGVHGRLDDVDRQLTALAREDEALWAEFDNTQDPTEGD